MFKVAFIPHTLAVTIAGAYETGTMVNLEADILARYVARNLGR
jgi:riboflavin synthase